MNTPKLVQSEQLHRVPPAVRVTPRGLAPRGVLPMHPQSSTSPVVAYRVVDGFPAYRVGTDGTVWSRWQYNGHQPRVLGSTWAPLAPQPDGDGYLCVNLYASGGRRRRAKVHQLVLMAFGGPRPSGQQACHSNGRADDCRLLNLRWDTAPANQRDRLRHGTDSRGERDGNARLTADDVLAIRQRLRAGETAVAICRDFPVSVSAIRAIKRRATWAWLEESA